MTVDYLSIVFIENVQIKYVAFCLYFLYRSVSTDTERYRPKDTDRK